MQKLGSWTSPKHLIGKTLDEENDPFSPVFHSSSTLGTLHEKSRSKKITNNEFTAMLEYVQLHATTRVAEIQHEKTKKETTLLNQKRQIEYTNQRLINELSTLRNTYSKYLSEDGESKRHMLRIQEKLNRAGLIEFECHNKLEMDRLNHLIQEKEFTKEIENLKGLLNLSHNRADKMEAKCKIITEEYDNYRTKVEQTFHKNGGLIMFSSMRLVVRRLLYRALCKWRAYSTAMVVTMLLSRKISHLTTSHQEELNVLKKEMMVAHANQVAFLNKEHAQGLCMADSRYNRVLLSRDEIYNRRFDGRGMKSVFFGKWKAKYIKATNSRMVTLQSEVLNQLRNLQKEEEEKQALTNHIEELTKEIRIVSQQRLCADVLFVSIKSDQVRLGAAFGRWKTVVTELRMNILKETLSQVERDYIDQKNETLRLEVQIGSGNNKMSELGEKVARYMEQVQDLRQELLLKKAFCNFKDVWQKSIIQDLRMKLGQYPNLWRMSRLEKIEEYSDATSF